MATLNFMGGKVALYDNSGDPLNGGKVYFYEPGGYSTPKDTYSDSGLTTPNANPVVLDAYGRADIWLSGNYNVIVKTSADVTIYSAPNINPDPTAGGDYTNKSGDVKTKSANYDVAAADDGNLIAATSGSWTLGTAVAAATLGNGFEFLFSNVGSGTVTFDPNSSETVDYGTGAKSTLSLISGALAHFRCDGSNWYGHVINGYRLRAIHAYTYDGTDIFIDGVDQNNAANTATWTKPDWCRAVLAIVVGGGGGSGYSDTSAGQAAAGSGGGGGGTSIEFLTSLSATETVTVGAGGTAGASAGSVAAGAGGTSSFGPGTPYLQATGGAAGSAGTSGSSVTALTTGSLGGVGSNGLLNIRGGSGGPAYRFSGTSTLSGHGGNSVFGGGAPAVVPDTAGTAGGAYGGGASGAASNNGADRDGAAGAAGIVVLFEFE